MAVKVEIRIKNSIDGGTDITFQATPKGKAGKEEIELANTIVCVCDLLSNDDFREYIEPWIANKLIQIRGAPENRGTRLM